MDCTICGKPALPGAMLCAPCKAALKRAKYVTAQEDVRRPSVIDVRRAQRRPRQASAAEGSEVPAPTPVNADAAATARLARRIFGGIIVLAAVLGGASYFGLRELSARSHDEAQVAPAPTPETQPATPAVDVAVPPSTPPTSAERSVPAEPTEAEVAHAKAAAAKLAASRAKRPVAKDGASFATANGDPPDAVPMPEPEKPAPAPPPPPPPAPDRWQSMRDAIAQCDREGLFSGIICGQKARIQYCEGYWGKVPQCPGPTANPER
jgi:hypothetical protein